jgi:hypothetical protein
MSYALDSKASDAAKRSADFNHFVVFDPYQVIACHDFEVCEGSLLLSSIRPHCMPECNRATCLYSGAACMLHLAWGARR